MVACRLPWKTRQKRDRATGGSLALPRVVEVLCPRSQALLAPGQASTCPDITRRSRPLSFAA